MRSSNVFSLIPHCAYIMPGLKYWDWTGIAYPQDVCSLLQQRAPDVCDNPSRVRRRNKMETKKQKWHSYLTYLQHRYVQWKKPSGKRGPVSWMDSVSPPPSISHRLGSGWSHDSFRNMHPYSFCTHCIINLHVAVSHRPPRIVPLFSRRRQRDPFCRNGNLEVDERDQYVKTGATVGKIHIS